MLYVAVTRAKEQFIAFASVENLENKIAKFAPGIANGKIDPVLCRRYLSDGDFIISAAMMHRGGDVLRKLSPVELKFAIRILILMLICYNPSRQSQPHRKL